MRQIHTTTNIAKKLGGSGTLEYELWVDRNGNLYVQITKNSDCGTFPQIRFSVIEYAQRYRSHSLGELIGLDLNGQQHTIKDNNADAFLRAVLRHLMEGVDSL